VKAQTHENIKWAQNHQVPHLVKFSMQNGASPNIMRSVILMLEDIQYEATLQWSLIQTTCHKNGSTKSKQSTDS